MMYIQWIVYFFATLTERQLYGIAHAKGMECEGYRNGVVCFNPNNPPQERSWLTFPEFKVRYLKKHQAGGVFENIWHSLAHKSQRHHIHTYISHTTGFESGYKNITATFSTKCPHCNVSGQREVTWIVSNLKISGELQDFDYALNKAKSYTGDNF